MAEINILFSRQPGAGFSPADTDSPLNRAAPARTPQQESQLLEALGTVLNALFPDLQGKEQPSSNSDAPGRTAGRGNGNSETGDPIEMLMQLLEALMPDNNTREAGNQPEEIDNMNGGSPRPETLGGGDAPPLEKLGRSLLQDSISDALSNAINPTSDGGGELSDNKLLKAFMMLIANLMDMRQDELGQPSDGSSAPDGVTSPAAPGRERSERGAPATTPRPDDTAASDTGKSGTVAVPGASKDATVVNETIKVGPGEVFDGGGKTFTAGGKLGDGGQSEGQKPMFELAPGATLKNVVFGDNAADGVHVHGDAKIDNVHWTNVGEDALTVKSSNGKPANVEITNSSAKGASDKIFQLNADANLSIDNFKAEDFGTFVRTNGGQQGNWNLNLNNIDAENGKFSFVKSDSEGLNVKGGNINLVNVNNHYKVPSSANLQVN